MRESLDFKSPVNKAEFYRPFQKNLPEDLKEDSPSQTAKQATEEGAKLQSQPLELTKQESQLPSQSQSQSQLKNDIIDDLYFQIIKEKVEKDKHKYEFNELGIWHKKIIKDLGSEEFIAKLIDWNSYNPKELTEDQKTIIIEQSDELIKLFTDRKITNFKKEGAVDGVYKEFLSEDSPSKEVIQPIIYNAKFESHRSVLKKPELQTLSQSDEEIEQLFLKFMEEQTKKDRLSSEQEIGKLYLQLLKEKTEKDKNETELERLEIWHKDIITYLGSNEFFNKLINWNSCNPEELTENQAIKIIGHRDKLIDLLTYRKIAITQPSVEVGPASPEDESSTKNRAEVPKSSLVPHRRLNESASSKFANNQGSHGSNKSLELSRAKTLVAYKVEANH